jgi:DNA-binding CsgD family transcriptional regulator
MARKLRMSRQARRDPERNRAIRLGAESYARRAWREAYQALSRADEEAPLDGVDLERLAIAAYLIGREGEFLATLERAYHAYVESGTGRPAIRCAFWLGMRLVQRGELAHGSGWLSRAQRLLEREQEDCAEGGYLLLPTAQRHLAAGDYDAAQAMAAHAAEIGDRSGDKDLAALARHLQGRCLLAAERVEDGLSLLDDAMLTVASKQLSPLTTGIIYCSVIEGCRQVYAVDRAQEWTSALAEWCAEQPDLLAFTGSCLVHRAEILELRGAWDESIEEARRAAGRLSPSDDPEAYAAAHYKIGEIHRLRGAFVEAEAAYHTSGEAGWEPQPGLALLWLAQGRTDAARAGIRSSLSATENRLRRARLLPACAEILLASGDVEEADRCCGELEGIAASLGTDALNAVAMHLRGTVAFAQGDTTTALRSLRGALQEWQRIEAPYLAARARALLGFCCRHLGDQEAAQSELSAAKVSFERLGAASDLLALKTGRGGKPRPTHGLTGRELEVLRLVAAGRTNKAIAAELGLSVKTIDRHVSNLLTKLDVPSRSAATAFAYEHGLI